MLIQKLMFEFVIDNVEQRTKGDLLMGYQKVTQIMLSECMHASF